MAEEFTPFMDDKSLPIRYQVMGAQTDLARVVFLPAYNAQATDYLSFAKRVSEETQIIIPEVWNKRPKTILSLADYVTHFGDKDVSPSGWALVGHGLGGTLALFTANYVHGSDLEQPQTTTVYQPWLPQKPEINKRFPTFQRGFQAVHRVLRSSVATHDALRYAPFGKDSSTDITILNPKTVDRNRYLLYGWMARHFPQAEATDYVCEHDVTKSWVQDALADNLLRKLKALSLKTKG